MQRPVPQWRRVATPIFLAFISFIAAIALWIAVTDAQNPGRVAVFGGGIEVKAVNVPEGLAVAKITEPTVSVRVSTDEDTFSELTTADFDIVVDLGGRRELEQVLRVLATTRNDDLEIVEVTPAFVTVTLEPETSKQVPVRANYIGSPPQGFAVVEVVPNPTIVTVRGAQSLVQPVASAAVDVNVTGLRVNVSQQLQLKPRDARGADIRGVVLDPPNAEVRVNIAQQEVTLTLTVIPQIQGNVADGYNLISVSSEPPALAVLGSLALLQGLSYVQTEPIDVSGLRADQTRTARLRLPVGLQSTRDSVAVQLKVVPAQGEIALAVAPQVTGVSDGMRATLQTSTLTLRLQGELPLLRSLAPGALRATVNASGLNEGVHVLEATITAPEGVRVVSVDPRQVVVILARQ